MRLWRISRFADLAGDGGLHAAGRWHSKGRRVVYLAEHPASAVLELLVHLEIDVEDFPTHFQLLEIDASDRVAVTAIGEASLPPGWRDQPAVTRARGDDWLTGGTTALLRVPSAIVPATSNYLLNPLHADAPQLSIAAVVRASLDPHLA
jgi:RES domain-containing protein